MTVYQRVEAGFGGPGRCTASRGRWQVKAAAKLEAPPVEESLEDQEEASWPGLFDSLLLVTVVVMMMMMMMMMMMNDD